MTIFSKRPSDEQTPIPTLEEPAQKAPAALAPSSNSAPDPSNSSATKSGMRKWTFMIDESKQTSAGHSLLREGNGPSESQDGPRHRPTDKEEEAGLSKAQFGEGDAEPIDTATFDALLLCITDDACSENQPEFDQAPNQAPKVEDEQGQAQRIRALNDAFRHTLSGGPIHLTAGIIALGARAQAIIFEQVRSFTNFSKDNDLLISTEK